MGMKYLNKDLNKHINKGINKNLIIALIIILIMYLFVYSIMHQAILSNNAYDSYTLQAQSWWRGETALEHDYSWLELATYKGGIYVSFPPFPSVPMFLLVPFFGTNTPSNLINSIYAILSFIVIFAFCKRKGLSDLPSLFWSAFAVFGSNLISISFFGGVWYQAQVLSFLMSALSIYFITSKKQWHWYIAMICWAFAIGCRPFQIVYLPIYISILYSNLKSNNRPFIHIAKYLVVPALIGGLYAWYNFIRFDNILEFGHNYLPEFIESTNGQFHWSYIIQNFPNLFRLPYFENNLLSFPKFNGFAFYIANPIFIVFFIGLIKRFLNKNLSRNNIIILGCIIVHIILFLAHKTLGGWQFGIRYFVDIIPFLFLSISSSDLKVHRYEIILFAFGLILNIYGTLWLMLEWA